VISIVIYLSDLRPDLLDEISGRLYMIVTKLHQQHLKRLIIGSAADFSHASRFVIDLSAIKDSAEEIAEALAVFRTMYESVRIVLLADREPPQSRLLARMLEMGIYNIVMNTGSGADDIRKCLTTGMTQAEADAKCVVQTVEPSNGHDELTDIHVQNKEINKVPPSISSSTVPPPFDQFTPPSRPSSERITANKDFKKHRPFITIAVCATEPHMGATHHALLIARFLTSICFKTCYLETHSRRDIFYLARAYNVNANERKRLLQFEGVDMVFDGKLSELVQAGYDFLVLDMGRFAELEPSSFFTKDIKLVIGGVKAWEMPAYTAVFDAIEQYGAREVQFILNHAPQKEQQAIRKLMGGFATHFAEYAPYPFATSVNLPVYKEVFADYLQVERAIATPMPQTEKNNHKSIFRWKGR